MSFLGYTPMKIGKEPALVLHGSLHGEVHFIDPSSWAVYIRVMDTESRLRAPDVFAYRTHNDECLSVREIRTSVHNEYKTGYVCSMQGKYDLTHKNLMNILAVWRARIINCHDTHVLRTWDDVLVLADWYEEQCLEEEACILRYIVSVASMRIGFRPSYPELEHFDQMIDWRST